MTFNPKEVATIVVEGRVYRDWKTVLVHKAMWEPFAYYKFTTTEGRPLAKDWAELRIRPGMKAAVILGGELAIQSTVTIRQVAYTATQHGIEIIGKTDSFKATIGGAEGGNGGEFRNKGFSAIAREVLGNVGVGYKTFGAINEAPFERQHISPGQTAWSYLEPLARAKGIILGSDVDGNIVAGVQGGGGDALVEGKNILEGRETLSIEPGTGINVTLGQGPGTDSVHGAAVAQVMGQASGGMAGFLGNAGANVKNIIMSEISGAAGQMTSRSGMEGTKQTGEQAAVQIVTQGWFRPSGGLWQHGQKAHVKSPMLILDESLYIIAVTFTQDDRSGTRTTIELVRDVNRGYHNLTAGGGGK
jgi:prophage tail gpP-like protein